MNRKYNHNSQAGFTIVELMISTVMFAVIMIGIMSFVAQISRAYYKGQSQARTQETARTVVEEISRAVQFSPGVFSEATAGNTKSFCFGQQKFILHQNQQTTGSTTTPGLTTAQSATACGVVPVAGTELLGNTMRVSKLSVNRIGSSEKYAITVRVIYGERDLLCPDGGDCSANTTWDINANLGEQNVRCKDIQSGSQFCAVSELSTIVERRLQ